MRARRAGLWGQGLRWSRRNPLAAASLAALVLMFVAAFAAVTYQWRRADAEANRANDTARAESALRIQAQVEATKRDLDYAMQLGRRGDADQGLLWTGKALSQAPPERPDLRAPARANIAAWTRQSPCLRAILEHQAAVYDAVFRPDGRAVLTGSCDGTAQVWDATTGRPIGLPMRHSDQVHSVAFSPDGRLILVSGSDGKVQLWNVATGQVAGPILSHGAEILLVAFAPDGRSFMTYGKDWSVRLWNTATGRPVGRLVGRGDSGSVEFSPDGRWLLTGGADGVARLWDAETARPTGVTFRHDDSVTSAKFSPDRRLVATGSKDGTTKFWDAATGQSIGPILRHSVAGTRIVFSPDGRLVLSADYDGTARLWDTATGRPVGLPLRHASEIRSSAFAPDGKLLVTGSFDHTARLWDTATGQPIGAPLRHRLPIRSASFSPDGRLILTASEDGTAKLWEVGSAEILPIALRNEDHPEERNLKIPAALPGVSFQLVAFSPDRERVLVAGVTNALARLVNTETGQPIGPPMTHRWPRVNALAFSPDGRHLATASRDVRIDEGGTNSTSATCQIWAAAMARPSSPLLPHINYVAALAFSPDGKVLASGDYTAMVHLWDAETGASLGQPLRAGSIVMSLAFSPDGQTLAAGTAERNNQLVLWDLASGHILGEPIRFKGIVNRLAFSPDGHRLAAASSDTTVRLVNVATGRAVGERLDHDEFVLGLEFQPGQPAPPDRQFRAVRHRRKTLGLDLGPARVSSIGPSERKCRRPSVLPRWNYLRDRMRGRCGLSLGRGLTQADRAAPDAQGECPRARVPTRRPYPAGGGRWR